MTEQQACTTCEGFPSAGNSPCMACGRLAEGAQGEREAFEAWFLRKFYEGDRQCGLEWLSTEPCGGYRHRQPAELWEVWQARAAMAKPSPVGQVPQAWLDVQAERLRQIEAEGWTLEHDDQHAPGELARAAAAYLLYAFPRVPFDLTLAARLWPWVSGFNPKGERRDLERAGALVLAALERLDRAAASGLGVSHD